MREQNPTSVEIGILDYPGAQRAAVFGLVDLFETADRLHRERGGTGPRLTVVPCRLEGGRVVPAKPLWAVIAPPSLTGEAMGPPNSQISDWLIERHKEGATLCSVCAGAFLLGDTGLLDGRTATTHWVLTDAFAERFPRVTLDADKLLIDDGDVLTAGGVMAWIDLGLRLINRLLGPSVMLATARMFLVDSGGREQSFYQSFAPNLTHGDAAVLKVQHWLPVHLGEAVSLGRMAAEAGLGDRTFLRRFQKAVGMNPTAYLQQLRVAKARERLELTRASVEEIAWRVGYEDPGAFRKVFTRIVGLSPGAYRRRFVIPA